MHGEARYLRFVASFALCLEPVGRQHAIELLAEAGAASTPATVSPAVIRPGAIVLWTNNA